MSIVRVTKEVVFLYKIILQLLVSGIAMGFVYGLVGIEYTLIWNSTGLLNFSHERIIMLGAYIFAGSFVLQTGLSVLPAIVATIIAIIFFAVFVAYTIFIPLRNMSALCAIMSTVMLGNIINESVRLYYGPEAITVKGFLTGMIRIGTLVVARAYVVIIFVALIILALLLLFMMKTKTGKAMRCVAQNKNASSLMGIDVQKNMMITIAISFSICSIIGLLVIPLYSVKQSMASMISLKGFAAGVIGGFGSLPGAIVGGLFIGIIENIAGMIFPSTFKDVVAFVCLILMLLLRPSGILGKKRIS
ncbi:MAG TPA: branched-chain amino acid ABC transporter permease [Christensenellaceae bacterium]|nr:branched-chain amino acid ABC transporter permease [Christensenellaceae bacterium]